MFAGPNGSGKTTIQPLVRRHLTPDQFGVYLNPDDLESAARRDGRIDLAPFHLTADSDEVRGWFSGSAFLAANGLAAGAAVIGCRDGVVDFGGLAVNSYHASVLADFLRTKLLAAGVSFSFETVMSDRSKVDLLATARGAGFRTYLYFVSTDDPDINIARVRLRVSQGGHDVPADKVVSRYHRSLGLLRDAVRHTDRAYFFDTSGARRSCVRRRGRRRTDTHPDRGRHAALVQDPPAGQVLTPRVSP